METRFCIEYVNPRHPLRDDGSINVRYDRVLTLEQAEHDLTLILSFGGKILDLYMGNVVDGETGEWSPKPMIVGDDNWFTTDWLKSLESNWKPSDEQMEHLNKSAERRLKHENIHRFRTVKKVGRDTTNRKCGYDLLCNNRRNARKNDNKRLASQYWFRHCN